MTRQLPRCIGAAIAGVVAGAVIAATASAHVHVEVDGEAIAGQPAQLVFEVPNERDDAATVAIEVQMPSEADLTDVVPEEVEGWTITTTTREGTTVDGDVIDIIRWEATGAGLVGEESAVFTVAVGPLPAVEFLTFPTIQNYDDGEVVRWIEPAPAGEPEPELPVPTLAITAAPADTTAPTEPAGTEPSPTEPPATEPAATEPAATEPEPTASTEAVVVATAPSDTADDAAPTEVSATPTTVENEDDDGSSAWPWVVAVIVLVVVGGGIAIAIARRRESS